MPTDPPVSRRMEWLCGGVVLLGSFLLFWIQPLFGQGLLPPFGGGAAVWSACLLFFQSALCLGYAYAHACEQLPLNRQRRNLHLGLLVAACLMLALTMGAAWKPAGVTAPLGQILLALSIAIGLPFVALSSTGPLVQSWYAKLWPERSPYRLYALSNLGAVLALAGYLLVLDPWLTLGQQSSLWLVGFIVFAGLFASLTIAGTRSLSVQPAMATDLESPEAKPTWRQQLAWFLLPAGSSLMLLATTNHLCQDLTASPLLWIAPLGLFLLSFIIAFDHSRWYDRRFAGIFALVALYVSAGVDNPQSWATAEWLNDLRGWLFGIHLSSWRPVVPMPWRIIAHCTALFAACFVLHGELYRARPASRFLTRYYFAIALGGATGSAFVSFLAPLIFATYFEWQIGIVTAFVIATFAAFILSADNTLAKVRGITLGGGLRAAGLIVAVFAFYEMIGLLSTNPGHAQIVRKRSRNFYGALAVVEPRFADPSSRDRTLFHGETVHGSQFSAEDRQDLPTTYYGEIGGAGRVLRFLEDRPGLRVGVVGMGVGTLAAYAKNGHSVRFYEINPAVVEIAEEEFTYLARARGRGADVSIVLGDARRSLEDELQNQQAVFDVIVLDAFNSDSIPAHLLTREAFEIYFKQLANDGTIAAHVSNRSLNLAAVVARIAVEFGIEPLFMRSEAYPPLGVAQAKWVILSHDRSVREELGRFATPLDESAIEAAPLWTDDHHSIWHCLE